MKLSVTRSELWRGIDTVLDAVPSKPALPVLSNILLVAEKDGLSLAATDLDLSIRTQIVAAVERPGSITVPARTFAEITREWPEAELTIEVSDDRLRLSGSLGEVEGSEGAYSLSGMPADDFPGMPERLSGLSLELDKIEGLDSQGLGKMISKTAFAVSRDDTRPVLNGVLWRIDAEGMLMVATDGHRFAHYRKKLNLGDEVQGEGADAIMPPQALSQVVKLLGGTDELVRVTLGESQVLFDLGATQLLSRLIEGPYVDYTQVIPKE
ncbi:DNA polymerase III subunit beta, partial [bacterium]|nr:DNA polymerase III subunit beta [bacterium]